MLLLDLQTLLPLMGYMAEMLCAKRQEAESYPRSTFMYSNKQTPSASEGSIPDVLPFTYATRSFVLVFHRSWGVRGCLFDGEPPCTTLPGAITRFNITYLVRAGTLPYLDRRRDDLPDAVIQATSIPYLVFLGQNNDSRMPYLEIYPHLRTCQ